ncbi:UDP-N-acetyl-D-glucosamine dehydrogenase [candidate division KSB3 bacterium]|uniref:UDP-N-acetyl-D-glucosamine dehydrogenase n=1 Tax=candidate division KSB3 bacterium TaxID=2044937 RepID=A0A2G6E2Z2_9BACT|nr:MAG: UDP-N-acetyl-D-glucosamine dehydrogenase [candidate division KSB3 bacterium]PIE28766.1 MAG: UDP-N-acetyl-D-glucosamine dehydrogenase [candidate division KSB3 bacterium]
MTELKKKIQDNTAKIGVIGLGYVGLPLAVEFGQAGFPVIGIDIDLRKVDAVNAGKSYIQDVPEADLEELVTQGMLRASSDFSVLREIDAVSICVPTPLRKSKDPDISYIMAAVQEIRNFLHPGQLIVLESTTYPGTTDEAILPELSKSGLEVGKDFFLAFSPERVDPGNAHYNTKNTPKVIGGVTPQCSDVAKWLYEHAINTVIAVSSTKCAEMVKLLENTFRSVNIGLVNELALMCDKLEVDVWEVIQAAASKPFGFMPFYPGPGLGGHCIPIDPYYLAWKMKTLNYNARFIELAGEINASMPAHVVTRIVDALNKHQKSVKGSRILMLGIAYKRDINDVRESPALDIISILEKKGAELYYHDPYIPQFSENSMTLNSSELSSDFLKSMDCTVLVTDHSAFDYQWMVEHSQIFVDTRNVTKNISDPRDRVVKL